VTQQRSAELIVCQEFVGATARASAREKQIELRVIVRQEPPDRAMVCVVALVHHPSILTYRSRNPQVGIGQSCVARLNGPQICQFAKEENEN